MVRKGLVTSSVDFTRPTRRSNQNQHKHARRQFIGTQEDSDQCSDATRTFIPELSYIGETVIDTEENNDRWSDATSTFFTEHSSNCETVKLHALRIDLVIFKQSTDLPIVKDTPTL